MDLYQIKILKHHVEQLLEERYAGVVAEQKLFCPACLREGNESELWAERCHAAALSATTVHCDACGRTVDMGLLVAARSVSRWSLRS